MAIAVTNFVNGDYLGGGNSANSTTTASATTAASGSTFIVCVAGQTNSPTISDSKANSYSLVANCSVDADLGASPGRTRMYVCVDGTGGSGHTFTASGTNGYYSVFAFEITGGDLVDPEKESASQNDTSTPFTDPGITTSVANSLLVAFMQCDCSGTAVITAGNSFTKQDEKTDGANVWVSAVATRIVSSTGTYNSTWTETNSASEANVLIAAFAEADSGPTASGSANLPSLTATGTATKSAAGGVTITVVDGDNSWADGDTGLVITGTGFV